MANDPRFIVLDTTGAHAIVGRYEVDAAIRDRMVADLRRRGIGAWLAEVSGSYYTRGKLVVKELECLTPNAEGVTFADAVALYMAPRAALFGSRRCKAA